MAKRAKIFTRDEISTLVDSAVALQSELECSFNIPMVNKRRNDAWLKVLSIDMLNFVI